MTIRHDARQCRAQAESERLRLSLGLLTPKEREARESAERKRREAKAREAAKGLSLFGAEP